MHDVLIDGLEDYLTGRGSRAFKAHLESCSACRVAVAKMEEASALFADLRTDVLGAPQPPLGFYNRVSTRIIEHQRKEAWGLFSPGALFFRRIAFASLLLLAGLGSYLVSRETSFENPPEAAAIMAQHDSSTVHNGGDDRDHMLVTLANYHE